MKSVFGEAGKTLMRSVFLLIAYIEPEKFGKVILYECDELILDKMSLWGGGERHHFTIKNGRSLVAAQEPAEWRDYERNRQPYDRTSSETYLSHDLGKLEVIPTSNGSRFLVLKKVWSEGCRSNTYVESYHPDREFYVSLKDLAEVAIYLNKFLPKMGVPAADVPKIKDVILSKFAA